MNGYTAGRIAQLERELVEARALIAECAPLILATAEAEHMLDGLSGRKPRRFDSLADRMRTYIASSQITKI